MSKVFANRSKQSHILFIILIDVVYTCIHVQRSQLLKMAAAASLGFNCYAFDFVLALFNCSTACYMYF